MLLIERRGTISESKTKLLTNSEHSLANSQDSKPPGGL